jgi:hypothetical protein
MLTLTRVTFKEYQILVLLPRKATETFSRICQLVMTICSDLFRDIPSRYMKPADLRLQLDNN